MTLSPTREPTTAPYVAGRASENEIVTIVDADSNANIVADIMTKKEVLTADLTLYLHKNINKVTMKIPPPIPRRLAPSPAKAPIKT